MAKRPIFQEVSSATPVLQPTANLIETAARGARGAIRVWLVVLFVMVAAMIALDLRTRLPSTSPVVPSSPVRV